MRIYTSNTSWLYYNIYHYTLGLKMELFNDQNFERIRKKHAELGVPWSDPTFGATNSSIGLSKVKDLPRNIEWKRPYVRFNFNSS